MIIDSVIHRNGGRRSVGIDAEDFGCDEQTVEPVSQREDTQGDKNQGQRIHLVLLLV